MFNLGSSQAQARLKTAKIEAQARLNPDHARLKPGSSQAQSML